MPKPIDNNQSPQIPRENDVSKPDSPSKPISTSPENSVNRNLESLHSVINQVVENNRTNVKKVKMKDAASQVKTQKISTLEDINKICAFELEWEKLDEQIQNARNSIENQ